MYMSILFLNILTLLAPTQSADKLFHSFTVFCGNENFLISSLHCFFAKVTPCSLVLLSSLTEKKQFFYPVNHTISYATGMRLSNNPWYGTLSDFKINIINYTYWWSHIYPFCDIFQKYYIFVKHDLAFRNRCWDEFIENSKRQGTRRRKDAMSLSAAVILFLTA